MLEIGSYRRVRLGVLPHGRTNFLSTFWYRQQQIVRGGFKEI